MNFELYKVKKVYGEYVNKLMENIMILSQNRNG